MLIFDLESDGLLDELTRIHTLHMYDTLSGQFLRFNEGFYHDGTPAPCDGSIEDAVEMLQAADGICGHNIINFDIPAITKLYPSFRPAGRVVDTLICTRYLWPHIGDLDHTATRKGRRPEGFGRLIGSHSLKAWGIRLGVHKGDYTGGWAHFTQEMEEYAEQDVVVTKALYERIGQKLFPVAVPREQWFRPVPEPLQLEHDTALVIHLQERFGFKFDRAAAEKLEGTLRARKAELEDQLRAAFPPWQEPERKGGKRVQFVPKRDNKAKGYKAGVPIQRYKTVCFNPGSRDHIANRLRALYDWTPVEFTPKGTPKLDETTLGGLDYPEARLLVEYLTVDKRLGALAEGSQAWLRQVKADGRIHGRVNTLGAITRRMTHSNPNMAQVPAVRAPYGAECRALFTVPEEYRLMGCDAEGLELRMLAHYMAIYDGGSYVKTVVEGKKEDGTDVHTVNQKFIALHSRDSAKTWIYAYLYGAGNLKLGSIIYDDMTEAERERFHKKYPPGSARDKALAAMGKKARDRVEAGLPALGRLQAKVKHAAARGYLKTVDGGLLRVRSAHAALNTLLQGGGAVVMKKALVILHQDLIEMGFDYDVVTGFYARGNETLGFTANVHDEFQMEVPEHLAEEIGQTAADAIRRAGEAFGLRCPLAGAFDVGHSWAASH